MTASKRGRNENKMRPRKEGKRHSLVLKAEPTDNQIVSKANEIATRKLGRLLSAHWSMAAQRINKPNTLKIKCNQI